MNSEEIRESFLKFFESRGHLRVASSSLIPVGDPTLLLTTAGMVQFKPYFVGESEPPNKRLTSSQKSFRTVDIDEVGDATHLTLFEMLGNFSIGDYFKESAAQFALDCFSETFGLPKDRFAITIHDTDDEARKIWRRVGVPADGIYRFGDQDNWWGPAGLEGPCGPCSELHYDFGSDTGCRRSDCGPNCLNTDAKSGTVCGRYVELWNLVFMQFYHHLDGTRTPLPAPSVDTGMGLERLAMVMQDGRDIWDTDLFSDLLRKVESLSGEGYGENPETDYAMRVVAEHGRSAAFLIADGVVPSNEGRGYVLRRVVRRGIRHGRRLGMEEPFLGQIADKVTEMMSNPYPELRNNYDFVQTVLRLEEERFQQTYDRGYAVLEQAVGDSDELAGDLVFRLWDTFGFPAEMTREIASERGVGIDESSFEAEMAAQRERGKSAARFGGDRARIRLYESLGVGSSKFLGYNQLNSNSVVIGLISGDDIVDEANEGDDIEIVLVDTPFYAEGGGQVGDAGEINGPSGKVDIYDTQAVMPGLIVHFGKVTHGQITMGESVDANVDEIRRQNTARNHTATHLLHAALRQVLGSHVRQAGSLVAPDRLRFDFSHVEALTSQEMEQVQWLVNERIRQNATVHKDEDSYQSAIERGALAFFGDRYDENVRLVEIANGSTFSFEVCGGTHVESTGELGAVYVLGESSIGASMRRIEAVSGRAAEKLVLEKIRREETIAAKLQATVPEITSKVESLLEEVTELRRVNHDLERRSSLKSAEGLLGLKRDVNGVSVLAKRVEVGSVDGLREMGDWLRDKMGSGVVVLGAVIDDRPLLVSMVTPDLVAAGLSASDIAKGAAKVMGGGGGGRPEAAQAGGRDADKLEDALDVVCSLVSDLVDIR
ncbi:alanine--tRNA ligase [Dehalococcoidia bacterium]|nr:alanine--tRNA ligase [Dehalococcoidia bacterium]